MPYNDGRQEPWIFEMSMAHEVARNSSRKELREVLDGMKKLLFEKFVSLKHPFGTWSINLEEKEIEDPYKKTIIVSVLLYATTIPSTKLLQQTKTREEAVSAVVAEAEEMLARGQSIATCMWHARTRMTEMGFWDKNDEMRFSLLWIVELAIDRWENNRHNEDEFIKMLRDI